MKRDHKTQFWQHFANLLLLVIGMGVVSWGTHTVNHVTMTLGGAIVGAVIGHWLSILVSRDSIREVKELLEKQTLASRKPGETLLEKKWHLYLPRIESGESKWVHIGLDFPAIILPETLRGIFSVVSPTRIRKRHQVEIERRDERLLFYIKPMNDDESITVIVFPTFFLGLQELPTGFAFVQTYDGNQEVVPALLSIHLICKERKEGEVSEPINRVLESLWQTGATSLVPHLPFVGSQ